MVVVCLLCNVTQVFAAVPVQNRFASTYTTVPFNTTYMMCRMNCYGYALRMFFKGTPPTNDPYKQQPGEFANNGTFEELMQEYYNARWSGNFSEFVKNMVFADFSKLGWQIYETTSPSQAPSGSSKIALAIKQNLFDADFHFYMQHSDGTWSHKMGESQVRNTSISSGTLLTNENISTKGKENGYDDYDIRFFVITKDAVLDYPHNDGHYPTCQFTTTAFKEKAGDIINHCTQITGSKNCRFDYSGDKDYFVFTPTISKNYSISTSCGSGFDIDGEIYNMYGNRIAYDYTINNASFNVYLNAYNTYYIGIWDAKGNIADYWLWCD